MPLPTAISDHYNSLSDNLKGSVILLGAAACFALMAALIKLAGETLPVVQILLVRQVVMLSIIAPSLWGISLRIAYATGRPMLQLARIVFALIAMLCGFTAVVHMPLADATAIMFAKSFFVTIFAVLVLRETVGVYRWSAVALGFVGVVVMLKPGTDSFTVYSLYALISAACAGLVMVIIRLLSRTESTQTIMLYQATGVGLIIAIPGLLAWQAPTTTQWLLLGAIGLVSYTGQVLNINAFRLGEASLLATLEYSRLLYATCLGWLLFGTLPGLTTWIGALIIVAAAVFTIHREARRKQTVLSSSSSGNGVP